MLYGVVADLFPCQELNLRKYQAPCGYIFKTFCGMSLGLMSPVEFKRSPSHRVGFRDPSPEDRGWGRLWGWG